MRQLKEKGVAIVFVTHFLEQVYAVCDRITVLRNGKLVGEYPIEELPRVRLVAAMMGKDFDDLAAVKTEQAKDFSKEPLFIDAKGLSHKGKINLRRGQKSDRRTESGGKRSKDQCSDRCHEPWNGTIAG